MDDDTAGWIILIGGLFLLVVLLAVIYDAGMNAGAKAHASGQVVVTTLPDGSQVVTKVKKEPARE